MTPTSTLTCDRNVAPGRFEKRRFNDLADEIRAIAVAIRRIGRGRGATPEAILIEKHDAAERLLALASRMEGGR